MRRAVFVITVFLLVCVSGIGQQVMYNYPPVADFSKFKTYKWVAPDERNSLTESTESELKAAIDRELARKGFVPAASDQADFYIGYEAAIGRKTGHASFDMGYAPSAHQVGWYAYASDTSRQSAATYVNELGICITDSSGVLVWHGLASMPISPDPAKQRKIMNRAVARLFKYFPPK